MPSLRALLELLRDECAGDGYAIGDQVVARLESVVRRTWPAQRVYITPLESRKNPARAAEIRALAKRLPTGVAAARLGVSSSYVRRVVRAKHKK